MKRTELRRSNPRRARKRERENFGFVALGNYRRPQKFHDVLGFVGAVRRGRRAP